MSWLQVSYAVASVGWFVIFVVDWITCGFRESLWRRNNLLVAILCLVVATGGAE